MFAVEIAKARHRLRTWVFAAGLALIGALPVIVLRVLHGSGQGGSPFFVDTVRNGLFAAVAAVGLLQPFFLPLGTALLAGESIASESSNGTLRYLLVRPVTRSGLVLRKYASVMALVGLAVLWVMVVGLVTGWIGFGLHPLYTLSGGTVGIGGALLRIVGASQVLDAISTLHAIHPYLPTHGWLAYADLFRSPVAWDAIVRSLELDAVYTVVFVSLALFTFGRRDVHS
jgi:ABC-2 type transport system permease protein